MNNFGAKLLFQISSGRISHAPLSSAPNCHQIPYAVRMFGRAKRHSPFGTVLEILSGNISGEGRLGLLPGSMRSNMRNIRAGPKAQSARSMAKYTGPYSGGSS